MIVSRYPLFVLQLQENIKNFCPNDPTSVHFKTNITIYIGEFFDIFSTFVVIFRNILRISVKIFWAILRDICEKACAYTDLQSLLETVHCINIQAKEFKNDQEMVMTALGKELIQYCFVQIQSDVAVKIEKNCSFWCPPQLMRGVL